MDVSHKRVQSTIVVNPYQMQTVEGEKGENDKFYTSPPKKSLRILGVQKPKASNSTVIFGLFGYLISA